MFKSELFELDAPVKGKGLGSCKIIWSYWHDSVIPALVWISVSSWKKNNPGYTINFLSEDTVSIFLTDNEIFTLKENLKQTDTPIVHYSDLVRLKILQKYGGFWVDATLVLLRPLEDLWVFSAPVSDLIQGDFEFLHDDPFQKNLNLNCLPPLQATEDELIELQTCTPLIDPTSRTNVGGLISRAVCRLPQAKNFVAFVCRGQALHNFFMYAPAPYDPYVCAWLREILSGLERAGGVRNYNNVDLVTRGWTKIRSIFRHYNNPYFFVYNAHFAIRSELPLVRYFDGRILKVIFHAEGENGPESLLKSSIQPSPLMIKLIGGSREKLSFEGWESFSKESTLGQILSEEQFSFFRKVLRIERTNFLKAVEGSKESLYCSFKIAGLVPIFQRSFICKTCPSNCGIVCRGCFQRNFSGPRFACHCDPDVSFCSPCSEKYQPLHKHAFQRNILYQKMCYSCAKSCHKGHNVVEEKQSYFKCCCTKCGNSDSGR
jgi:hypothetical protein